MPKNTYAKGDRLELMVKGYLERTGWSVFRVHRKANFIGPGQIRMVGADVFGCDIIGLKADAKPVFIQVSTMANKSKKISQVTGFPWPHQYVDLQIWLKHDKESAFEILQAPDFGSIGKAYMRVGKEKK